MLMLMWRLIKSNLTFISVIASFILTLDFVASRLSLPSVRFKLHPQKCTVLAVNMKKFTAYYKTQVFIYASIFLHILVQRREP